jgi:hypothetical protein
VNTLPDTPALPGLSGPRSKLSPAKSSGTTGPGCPASIVTVTGWAPGREDGVTLTPALVGRKARHRTP